MVYGYLSLKIVMSLWDFEPSGTIMSKYAHLFVLHIRIHLVHPVFPPVGANTIATMDPNLNNA